MARIKTLKGITTLRSKCGMNFIPILETNIATRPLPTIMTLLRPAKETDLCKNAASQVKWQNIFSITTIDCALK